MKMNTTSCKLLPCLLLALSELWLSAASPNTAFTYQGRLFIGDAPANGLYDLQFTNYDAATGGKVLGAFHTNALSVNNGLFTVALDFGTVFDGTPRWLEISERASGAGTFGTLAPRQLLAAAPYATYAASAGAVPGLTILQNANGAPNVIAGSPGNWVASGVVGATISGGGATNYHGSGWTNSVSADFGAIGGGNGNTIQTTALWATIGGGVGNTVQTNAQAATISGGLGNIIQRTAYEATIGGGGNNVILYSTPYATISGGATNVIQFSAPYSTIGGGGNNVIQYSAPYATIGGGEKNGIRFNTTNATIGGGLLNQIYENANGATIGGGGTGTRGGNWIGAYAFNATIGGGNVNRVSDGGSYGTIPGGNNNIATTNAFAAGTRAQALHSGSFVWSDPEKGGLTSTAANQFSVGASGGARFVTSGAGLTVDGPVSTTNTIYADSAEQNPGALLPGLVFGRSGSGEGIASKRTSGTDRYGLDFYTQGYIRMTVNNGGKVGIGTTTPGYLLVVGGSGSPAYCDGTSWVNGSDRNAKEAFTAINPRAVLEKVSALPITEWKYKGEPDGTEHIGPMAQDFHAAFGLNGPDDKHIATVDEEGVALAAIQGLNQKLEETRADNAALRADNAELRARLEKLERLLQPSK